MSGLVSRVKQLRERLGDDTPEECRCQPRFEEKTLVVDASNCPKSGDLAHSSACRNVVITALTSRDVETIRIEYNGIERRYSDSATALLVAAGQFVERCRGLDNRLAERATLDPLAAAREAIGRAGPVATLAAETGLADCATHCESYEDALRCWTGPTISHWQVETTAPTGAALATRRTLETGAIVRIYTRSDGYDQYHLTPPEQKFDQPALAQLATAYEGLAAGRVSGTTRAPARAIEHASNQSSSEETTESTTALVAALEKHARGYGLLEDLFSDGQISDIFVTAPPEENPLRVTVDGNTVQTNVQLTAAGVRALASRFRKESGRPFSRADPTLDATTTIADRPIRVAGVTEPTSTGTAFAFRAADERTWTIPALITNGTLSARAAAVLSVAVERGGALLTAGPRGAGKTTLLGALLWELPPTVRTVVIEDTAELPVESLQRSGRDVQPLLTDAQQAERTPAQALRTALRLGNGALVVGEVRGEEAAVLYEAMRVGAQSEAVLGTIHGDGAQSVYERVVTDLGVPASSFGATDLIVTCEVTPDGTRRVRQVEELTADGTSFASLFKRTKTGLESTGRVGRGQSTLLATLTRPEESYADVRKAIKRRERLLETLANRGKTGASAVTKAIHQRNTQRAKGEIPGGDST